MQIEFVLRNAKIITLNGIIKGDIAVNKGKIVKVGEVMGKGMIEWDVKELFVLPGAIDMHVHFRDPGAPEKEDFESGSGAAAAGGVTTIVDMPNTNPPTLTVKTLEDKRAAAASKSHVNFGLYMGLTDTNLEEIKTAKATAEKGGRKLAGVKVYMGASTGNLLVKDMKILEELFSLGLFVIVHAEDESIIEANKKKYADEIASASVDPAIHSKIRSVDAAYEAVKQVLHIAKKHNARVHITHVTSAKEVAELRKFKSPLVTADATPHHLFLSDSAYQDRGNLVKVNPPLRTNEDRNALWQGIKEGLIQAVASDHAPHLKSEKERPYAEAPSGVPGVETLLPLLLDASNHGELSLADVVRITSQNPAAILGLKNKGRIEEGADADLVVVNLEEKREVGKPGVPGTPDASRPAYFTKCNWSPFAGWKLQGWPVLTIVNGHIAFEHGKVHPEVRGKELN